MKRVWLYSFALVFLTAVSVVGQVVSGLLPEGFPTQGLVQVSTNTFESTEFGSFTVNATTGKITHSVLGELEWNYDTKTGLVSLDTVEWGVLTTTFESNSEVGYTFPSVYSMYFESRYDVDYNNSYADGSFYSYEMVDGSIVGWTDYIGFDPVDSDSWLGMVIANCEQLKLLKVAIEEATMEMSDIIPMIGITRPEELRDIVYDAFEQVEPTFDELMYAYYRLTDLWNDLLVAEGQSLRVQKIREQADSAFTYAMTAQSLAVISQQLTLSEFEQSYNTCYNKRAAYEAQAELETERTTRETPLPFSYIKKDEATTLESVDLDWSSITVLDSMLDLTSLTVEAELTDLDIFEGAYLSSEEELTLIFTTTRTENWTLATTEESEPVEPVFDEDGNQVIDEGSCWIVVPKTEIDGRKAEGYYAFPFALFNGTDRCAVRGASLVGQTPLPESWRPNIYTEYGFFVTSNNGGRSNVVVSTFPEFDGAAPPWKLHFSDVTASSSGKVDSTKDAIDWDVVEVVELGIDDVRNYEKTASITKWRIHVGNYFRPWYSWYVEIESSGTEGWQKYLPYSFGQPISGNLWIFVPKATGGYYAAPFEGYAFLGNPSIFSLSNLNFESAYDVLTKELAFPWMPSQNYDYGWMITTNAGPYPGSNGKFRTNIVMQSFPAGTSVEEVPEYDDYYEYEGVDCDPSDSALSGSPALSSSDCELVLSDALQGSTVGQLVGGKFATDGYRPLAGENHILYEVDTIKAGYVEFEVKGMNNNLYPYNSDSAFFCMYDGRGINEPIQYGDDYKHNFFRWNVHYRQNRCAIKCVVLAANPTPDRLNASKAVFSGNPDRDWYDEPTGNVVAWQPTQWYKFRIEWQNKHFSVFVNNNLMWQTDGPNEYAPIVHRMWLGSGPGKYDADISSLTYRNFKVYKKK